eukprot:GHUV01031866.1.p1 GENE.GHUV01031866.1~~GHUV01031866.1.p1  ORF type:complete len:239 (+),score=40.16 GHUV01031866.1:126-842(+)
MRHTPSSVTSVAAMTRTRYPAVCPRLGAGALFTALCYTVAASHAFEANTAADGKPNFIDITLTVRSGMPVWKSSKGLHKNWRTLFQSIDEGDVVNQSWLNLDAHTGTHADAPAHFLEGGGTVEQLDLEALIGSAYVADVPPGSNVTADVLQSMQLPSNVERLLFKTENTAKGLLHKREFVSDYIGLDSTAAEYLGRNTRVRLVGVDYLSVGMLEDIQETHKRLFREASTFYAYVAHMN